MPGLEEVLGGHARVGFDTSAFIYELENVPPYVELTRPLFRRVQQGSLDGVTSVLTLMELIVLPLRLNQPWIADDYESLLLDNSHLQLVPVDRAVARQAAELRASYRLPPVDAIHMASCMYAGATAFLTNDRRLSRVPEIEVLLLDEFLV